MRRVSGRWIGLLSFVAWPLAGCTSSGSGGGTGTADTGQAAGSTTGQGGAGADTGAAGTSVECPFPAGTHTATREPGSLNGAAVQVTLTVDAAGAITAIDGLACAPVPTRQALVDIYTGRATCFASHRCGGCVFFTRFDAGAYLLGLDGQSEQKEKECPDYAGAQFELPTGGGGTSDPWLAGSCGALGATQAPSGACVLGCKTNADCPGSGMSCPSAWKICRKTSCQKAADCGPGWDCVSVGLCVIPCTTPTSGGSSQCPSSWPCKASGTDGTWCTAPSGLASKACSDCLSTCKNLPGCCTGCGCMCESECNGC